jgi:hypothetical protein
MATYVTNLATITLCQNATGFSELASPHSSGSTPGSTSENYIQDGNAVDQATGQAADQAAGMQFTGSALSWTASSNWVVIGWLIYASPTNLKAWASGGFRVGIGSSDDNHKLYNAMGNNFGRYPYGGWQSVAIDPEFATPDQTIGSPGSSYTSLAFLPNVTVKITKGSPIAVDAWRYGRGDIVVTGADCTFVGMAAANDADTAKWGLFQFAGGTYLWKGLMSLGTSGASVTFSGSNRVIRVDDTPRVKAGFNAIEITNASSSVTWDTITFIGVQTSITGSTPVSQGSFKMVDNATVAFTSCVFIDMETFIFQSNATVLSSTFLRCKAVTSGGGTYTGSKVLLSTVAADASAFGWNVAADPDGYIDNMTFSKGANAHHAIGFGASAPATINLNGIAFSGFNASDGQDDSTLHFADTGGDVDWVVNCSGCTGNITYKKVRGNDTVTINLDQNTFKFTLSPSITGYEWRLYSVTALGSLDGASELDGEETATADNQTYTYVYGGDIFVALQIMSQPDYDYEESITYYTLEDSNQNIILYLNEDKNN